MKKYFIISIEGCSNPYHVCKRSPSGNAVSIKSSKDRDEMINYLDAKNEEQCVLLRRLDNDIRLSRGCRRLTK